MNIGESDLHNRLAFILAGRSAEKLVFGEFSAGAENDLDAGHSPGPQDGVELGHE